MGTGRPGRTEPHDRVHGEVLARRSRRAAGRSGPGVQGDLLRTPFPHPRHPRAWLVSTVAAGAVAAAVVPDLRHLRRLDCLTRDLRAPSGHPHS
jgi:hypothetical protein